jgi:hypothetical protein
MSIKTIKQRIALVAVTALTAGVLSVATSPVANAAAGDIDWLYDNGSSGICAVYNNSAGAYVALTGRSVSTLASTRTVTVALGGVVALDVEDDFTTFSSNGVLKEIVTQFPRAQTHVAVGGAGITTAGITYDTSTFDTRAELHSSYGVFYGIDDDTITLLANAVGTATVNSYAAAPFSAVNTATTGLAAGASGVITIIVVAACSSTGYSAADSAVEVTTAATSEPSLTRGDTLTFGAGSAAFISVVGKNSYGAALPATTVWTISATNGALVKVAADGATAATVNATTYSDGTLSSASGAATGTNVYFKVVPASKAAGATTTVTILAGTTTVTTKTITFLPEASKLVVVKNLVGAIAEGEGAFSFQLQTASGQAVPGTIAVRPLTLDSRVTNVTQNKAATIAPAAPANVYGAASTGYFGSTTTNGIMNFTCNTAATSGTTTVTMRHTTPVTETVIDTPVTVRCSGGLATYTMSLDKAAYKIGEVATITITGKDSAGNVVKDNQAFTADVFSVGGGSMVVNSKTTDLFSDGVKTFQAQMTTAGSFNAVSTLAGSVTKSATAAYTVSGGDASNAEVLKSIVALIASINKQIQALQKLILKR